MNIDYYRNYVKIVETGTLSAASRELLVAQPALSNQLKSLEKEYGTQLLERGARHIQLTSAGKILYEKAKTICCLEDAAQKEIDACVSGHRGTLKLGLTPAYPDPFSSNLLLDFNECYPHISYEIFEASSNEIMEYIKNSLVEIGVIRTPTFIPPIFDTPVSITEQLMVVFRRENPWLSPDLATIPISDLVDIPLSISRGFHTKVTDMCLEAGFAPHLLNVCTSRAVALMWASRGTSVAIIVATSSQDQENEMFCCRPIMGKSMSTKRSFATLKERQLSAVSKLFLEFCKQRTTI